VASTTRIALLAIDIRLNRTAIPRRDILNTLHHCQHFYSKLMTGDARVAEKWHLSEIAAVVRATNADAMDAHECFARRRLRWLWQIKCAEFLRRVE
jgi:hypothetical protein